MIPSTKQIHASRSVRKRACMVCKDRAFYQAGGELNWSLCGRHGVVAVCNGFPVWSADGRLISMNEGLAMAKTLRGNDGLTKAK